VVVGLGNPGPAYQHTRHNLGWLVLVKAAQRWGVNFTRQGHALQGLGHIERLPVTLVLPQTWMNNTGVVVHSVLQDLHLIPPDLIVVYDDLDLPLGGIKIKTRGGAGGHNGLRSVVGHLESEDFIRLKVGIGRAPTHVDPAQYVLSSFLPEERKQIEMMLPKAVDVLECLICEGASVAMNRFHGKSAQQENE